MENDSIYKQHGFENRRAYLESLCDDFGLPLGTVVFMANMLGESEDFDGLITMLEDEADRISESDYEIDVG
jgi:hypothetical protein